MSNAIRKLQMKIKPRVAITQGHGEPDSIQVNDFLQGLREYYDVSFVQFGGMLNTFRDTVQNATQIRNKFDAVIMIRDLIFYHSGTFHSRSIYHVWRKSIVSC